MIIILSYFSYLTTMITEFTPEELMLMDDIFSFPSTALQRKEISYNLNSCATSSKQRLGKNERVCILSNKHQKTPYCPETNNWHHQPAIIQDHCHGRSSTQYDRCLFD